MGLLDFLFKKKKPEIINYDSVIDSCWEIFREGFKNPNPKTRRAVEESVLNIDSPDGKRFFSVGMQDPDIDNKLFCLKKVYERGGWRLAENILKIAYENEENLSDDKRIELISFFSSFSDSDASDFMEVGLEDKNIEIRLATIFSICGTKSSEKMKLIESHLEKSTDEFEKYACFMALWQFNNSQKKSELDNIIEKNINSFKHIEKLKYLEFSKSKQYIEKIIQNNNNEIKLLCIDMINDNRGIEFLKLLIKDTNSIVIKKAIEKVIEIGSRSALETIKSQESNSEVSEQVKLALAIFGDKELIKKFEAKSKSSELDNENIELINKIALFPEQNISEIINTFLSKMHKLDDLNEKEIYLLDKIVYMLIKYGKLSSISFLEKYINVSYLNTDDNEKIKIVCNSATAILCIIERNTTYYTQRMKDQDNI
ncbi:MAG: hypothetical protein AABZ74_18100 [Cyanobacteriota bacterium]